MPAMPDIHVPEAEELEAKVAPAGAPAPRRRSLVKLGLEVLLIALGVFLGLAGEQWREARHEQALARASLLRFRAELAKNRDAVVAVRDKHRVGLQTIQRYLAAEDRDRRAIVLPTSTSPAFLEYAAWDLAIATQSLGDIDQELAQRIAGVYAVQRQLDNATRTITDVMYAKGDAPNPTPFLTSLSLYFGDCNLIEPRLLTLYDGVLGALDTTLGEATKQH